MQRALYYRFLHNSQLEDGHLAGLMRGYKLGDELTLAFEHQHEAVAMPEDVTDEMVCDSLFATFNGTGRGTDYYGPSMSVGDVIQISEDGVTYRSYGVDSVGCKDLGTAELKFLPRPAEWGPKQPV